MQLTNILMLLAPFITLKVAGAALPQAAIGMKQRACPRPSTDSRVDILQVREISGQLLPVAEPKRAREAQVDTLPPLPYDPFLPPVESKKTREAQSDTLPPLPSDPFLPPIESKKTREAQIDTLPPLPYDPFLPPIESKRTREAQSETLPPLPSE